MKKLIRSLIAVLALALVQGVRAVPYTNYLDEISNTVAFAYSQPFPAKAITLLGKALKDLEKPSDSVAGDYKIFFAVATHLMPLTSVVDPGSAAMLGTVSSNAFTNFTTYAVTKIGELNYRMAAITPFQPLRRAASNQLAGAVKALMVAGTTSDIRLGILSVGLAIKKTVVAEALLTKAEANQGFALDSLEGLVLSYDTGHDADSLYFSAGGIYSSTADPVKDYGTYTFTRTGLSTGTLVLESQDGQGTTTVKLKFTNLNGGDSAEGTFGFRNSEGGSNSSGKGTFTTTSP